MKITENIEIYKGDCLEWMKEIESSSIDAIITDPPYGTTACKWDSVIDFNSMWEQLNRIIKPNGAIVLFGSEPFSSALRISNIKNYKYDWIWQKNKTTGFLNAKKQPMNDNENIIVFYKKQCSYNPQKNKAEKLYKRGNVNGRNTEVYGKQKEYIDVEVGTRYPKRIQYFNNNNNEERHHPTQKPVELMEYLIKTYTNEDESVLDFTMGSGSTGIACVNTKRKFLGIEQDDKYFEIAKERINNAIGQTKLF